MKINTQAAQAPTLIEGSHATLARHSRRPLDPAARFQEDSHKPSSTSTSMRVAVATTILLLTSDVSAVPLPQSETSLSVSPTGAKGLVYSTLADLPVSIRGVRLTLRTSQTWTRPFTAFLVDLLP